MKSEVLKQKSKWLLLVSIIGLSIGFLVAPANPAKADIYDDFHVESDYVEATSTGFAYEINYMYVQHRKYENGNSFNRLSFGIRDDFGGYLTSDSEVVNVELYDPGNNLVTLDNLRFLSEDGLGGRYDADKSQLFYWDFAFESYFVAEIPANLDPGTYRLKVTLSNGTVLERSYVFNQLVNLPIIRSKSFRFHSDQSGNVLWKWDIPIELVDLSLNYQTSARASIEIYNDKQYVGSVTLRLPSHMGGIFIPYDLIQKMESKGDGFKCRVQLRGNDNNNRTYSNTKKFKSQLRRGDDDDDDDDDDDNDD